MAGVNESCDCGRPARWWCDWKMPRNEYGLCNRPLCAEHASNVGEMKYLCPEHAQAYAEWKRRQQATVSDKKWNEIKP